MASGLTSVHFMAGGGGDFAGFLRAGYGGLAVVNHLDASVDTCLLNDPTVQGVAQDVEHVQMVDLPKANVLVGSPICTEAAPSGGNAYRKQKENPWKVTRITAWSLVQYALQHRPEVIVGENVLGFAKWELFDSWLYAFEALGYEAHCIPVNAAHVSSPGNPGAAQVRERMVFVLVRMGIKIDLEIRPDAMCPECGPVQGVRFFKKSVKPIRGFLLGEYDSTGKRGAYFYTCPNGHGRVEPVTWAMRDGIDWSLPMNLIADGHSRGPYAEGTRARIQHGLDHQGGKPFVVIYRKNKWSESLDGPVAALTSGGTHHYLVVPGDDMTVDGCMMRRFSLAEKAYMQRFPQGWKFADKFSDADRLKIRQADEVGTLLTGNAVPSSLAQVMGERVHDALVLAA